jgi:hypothetical protein
VELTWIKTKGTAYLRISWSRRAVRVVALLLQHTKAGLAIAAMDLNSKTQRIEGRESEYSAKKLFVIL